MKSPISQFLACLLLVGIHNLACAELSVLVSFKPLALITQDLLGEQDQIKVLLPRASSPHDYVLKVSDRTAIENADLVVWMGPGLERFLVKVLNDVPQNKVLRASASTNLSYMEKALDSDDHQLDFHTWLDPIQVMEMTRTISQRLVELAPERKDELEQRRAAQLQRLMELDQELAKRFATMADEPFVAYHQAYNHLLTRYGLNQMAIVSVSPDRPPGAKHLVELQQQLQRESARCLFVEASHEVGRADTLARQLALQVVPLDILGQKASTYYQLMEAIANNMLGCLAP